MLNLIGYTLPLFHAFAAYALSKKKTWLSMIILLPFIALSFFILVTSVFL